MTVEYNSITTAGNRQAQAKNYFIRIEALRLLSLGLTIEEVAKMLNKPTNLIERLATLLEDSPDA